jgi:hypothetical protein
MIRPIEGANRHVSVPTLVVGAVWALAGEPNIRTIAVDAIAMKNLYMLFFLNYLVSLRQHAPPARQLRSGSKEPILMKIKVGRLPFCDISKRLFVIEATEIVE